MKPIVLIAIAALLGLAGCESADQQLAAQGEVQLPGTRAGMKAPLTTPPDEWAGPARVDSRNGPHQESEAAAR
jgi:predicted small lipoprotein YifL